MDYDEKTFMAMLGDSAIMELQKKNGDIFTAKVKLERRMVPNTLNEHSVTGYITPISEEDCTQATFSSNLDVLVKSAYDLRKDFDESFLTIAVNKHGNVVFWDSRAEKVFGYTADEVHGVNLGDLIFEKKKTWERCQKGIEATISSKDTSKCFKQIRVKAINKNKDELHLVMSFTLTETEDQTILTALIRDVTSQLEFV